MANEQQAYLGRFELTSVAQNFTLAFTGIGTPSGNQLVTLDAREYYMAGHAAETEDQLCEEIQAKIRQIGTDYAAATCALDLATGRITLAGFAYAVDITWTDPLIGSYLGWDSGVTGATSYLAPYPARFVWRPSLCASKLPVDLATFWEPRSNSSLHIAPDGNATGSPGALQNRAAIAYDLLDLAEILVDEDGLPTGNATFEQFFRDVFHAMQPTRIVIDRTSYATEDDYKSALFGMADGTSPLGALRDWITPYHGEMSHDLWNVDLFFAEYVGEGA